MKNLLTAAMIMGALVFVAVPAAAGPAINLDTLADWNTAIGAGTVRPMTAAEFTDLQTANPTGSPFTWPGTYSTPELAVADGGGYALDGGETLDGPGLVMGWGTADGSDYTAAWRFEYPLDPNIVGQTLTLTVCPPQFAQNGAQMNSIGIGFTDVAGLTRTWTWGCGPVAIPAASTIAWNQNWNVTIGPILGVMPPAVPPDPGSAVDKATGLITVPPIYFGVGAGPPFGPIAPPTFNPMMAMFLDAYENGAAIAPPGMPLPPGGLPNVPLWNWWQNVVVTPEPTTLVLLCGAGLPMLLRRRRRS